MVYADYTKKETRFIEGIMRRHGPKLDGPMRVLEPACGSGRLLESLAARGHVVHGFDLNKHQIPACLFYFEQSQLLIQPLDLQRSLG